MMEDLPPLLQKIIAQYMENFSISIESLLQREIDLSKFSCYIKK